MDHSFGPSATTEVPEETTEEPEEETSEGEDEPQDVVSEIQRVLGVKVDGVWGNRTDAKFIQLRRRYLTR